MELLEKQLQLLHETMTSLQEKISTIAIQAWSNGRSISVPFLVRALGLKESDLCLNKNGDDVRVLRLITSTYKRALREGNRDLADCIETSFTDRKGNFIWKTFNESTDKVKH